MEASSNCDIEYFILFMLRQSLEYNLRSAAIYDVFVDHEPLAQETEKKINKKNYISVPGRLRHRSLAALEPILFERCAHIYGQTESMLVYKAIDRVHLISRKTLIATVGF